MPQAVQGGADGVVPRWIEAADRWRGFATRRMSRGEGGAARAFFCPADCGSRSVGIARGWCGGGACRSEACLCTFLCWVTRLRWLYHHHYKFFK